jgi:cystathionine gamma-synthase
MPPRNRLPLKPRTLLAQALGAGDPTTHALVPPIHMSSTYLRDPDNGYESGYVYGRTDNASVRQVEAVLSSLESAQETLLFGSGMAAATTVVLALEKPSHIVAPSVMYWGFREWLRGIARYGHSVTFVDTTDLDAIRAAVRPGQTALFWIETPSNPLWSLTDIEKVAQVAHDAGALLCVDSTAATPIITRPIEFGADFVMHSATKYLNGHSDLIAGSVSAAADSAHWQAIKKMRGQLGAIVGSFEAWLLMRGMRTLDVRVREQSRCAAELAERLLSHDGVAEVLYPGLAHHPGHDIAKRQMGPLFGGMLSIRVKGGETAAVRTAARIEVWNRATSLGGVESLIEHRASIEGTGTPCPTDLLRLSVGLEDPDDLYDDLAQALDGVAAAHALRKSA